MYHVYSVSPGIYLYQQGQQTILFANTQEGVLRHWLDRLAGPELIIKPIGSKSYLEQAGILVAEIHSSREQALAAAEPGDQEEAVIEQAMQEETAAAAGIYLDTREQLTSEQSLQLAPEDCYLSVPSHLLFEKRGIDTVFYHYDPKTHQVYYNISDPTYIDRGSFSRDINRLSAVKIRGKYFSHRLQVHYQAIIKSFFEKWRLARTTLKFTEDKNLFESLWLDNPGILSYRQNIFYFNKENMVLAIKDDLMKLEEGGELDLVAISQCAEDRNRFINIIIGDNIRVIGLEEDSLFNSLFVGYLWNKLKREPGRLNYGHYIAVTRFDATLGHVIQVFVSNPLVYMLVTANHDWTYEEYFSLADKEVWQQALRAYHQAASQEEREDSYRLFFQALAEEELPAEEIEKLDRYHHKWRALLEAFTITLKAEDPKLIYSKLQALGIVLPVSKQQLEEWGEFIISRLFGKKVPDRLESKYWLECSRVIADQPLEEELTYEELYQELKQSIPELLADFLATETIVQYSTYLLLRDKLLSLLAIAEMLADQIEIDAMNANLARVILKAKTWCRQIIQTEAEVELLELEEVLSDIKALAKKQGSEIFLELKEDIILFRRKLIKAIIKESCKVYAHCEDEIRIENLFNAYAGLLENSIWQTYQQALIRLFINKDSLPEELPVLQIKTYQDLLQWPIPLLLKEAYIKALLKDIRIYQTYWPHWQSFLEEKFRTKHKKAERRALLIETKLTMAKLDLPDSIREIFVEAINNEIVQFNNKVEVSYRILLDLPSYLTSIRHENLLIQEYLHCAKATNTILTLIKIEQEEDLFFQAEDDKQAAYRHILVNCFEDISSLQTIEIKRIEALADLLSGFLPEANELTSTLRWEMFNFLLNHPETLSLWLACTKEEDASIQLLQTIQHCIELIETFQHQERDWFADRSRIEIVFNNLFETIPIKQVAFNHWLEYVLQETNQQEAFIVIALVGLHILLQPTELLQEELLPLPGQRVNLQLISQSYRNIKQQFFWFRKEINDEDCTAILLRYWAVKNITSFGDRLLRDANELARYPYWPDPDTTKVLYIIDALHNPHYLLKALINEPSSLSLLRYLAAFVVLCDRLHNNLSDLLLTVTDKIQLRYAYARLLTLYGFKLTAEEDQAVNYFIITLRHLISFTVTHVPTSSSRDREEGVPGAGTGLAFSVGQVESTHLTDEESHTASVDHTSVHFTGRATSKDSGVEADNKILQGFSETRRNWFERWIALMTANDSLAVQQQLRHLCNEANLFNKEVAEYGFPELKITNELLHEEAGKVGISYSLNPLGNQTSVIWRAKNYAERIQSILGVEKEYPLTPLLETLSLQLERLAKSGGSGYEKAERIIRELSTLIKSNFSRQVIARQVTPMLPTLENKLNCIVESLKNTNSPLYQAINQKRRWGLVCEYFLTEPHKTRTIIEIEKQLNLLTVGGPH